MLQDQSLPSQILDNLMGILPAEDSTFLSCESKIIVLDEDVPWSIARTCDMGTILYFIHILSTVNPQMENTLNTAY